MENHNLDEQPVEIICILDRSGSMQSMAVEVINSFNNFVDEQKAEKGEANLTLVLFDDKYEVVYNSVSLDKVKPITSKEYFARGMTGLFDAIGKSVNACTAKDAMVLIQTDGQENSSKEYTKASVKKLITEKEDAGWDFIFLGANIDAATEGAGFGMSNGKSFGYDASVNGTKDAFMAMSNATSDYRSMKLGNK